jgi:hypothetical protein
VSERRLPTPEQLARSAGLKPGSAGLKPRLHDRTALDLPVGREAVTLPMLLLTVAGAGGLRVDPAGRLSLVPPSLMALVLGVMLMATLVRSGALAPDRLIGDRRSTLENASGAIVLASLLLAAAQMFMLLTPPTGLLGFVFTAFFLLLLWNTLAVSPDRRQLLRSLAVVFGGAFVLKFIVLAAAYDAGGGLLHRVILAMLQGVSLGALGFVPDGAATGYVAFFLIGLFFFCLVLLPGRQSR